MNTAGQHVFPVTPERAWAAFRDTLVAHQRELCAAWMVAQRTDRGGAWTDAPFTRFMEDIVYPSVAARLHTTPVREYQRFDLVLYGPQGNTALGLAAAEVVLEHENHRDRWTEELVKLGAVDAPLRVLVFYTEVHRLERSLEAISAYLVHKAPVKKTFLAIWGEYEANSGPAYEAVAIDQAGTRRLGRMQYIARLES